MFIIICLCKAAGAAVKYKIVGTVEKTFPTGTEF